MFNKYLISLLAVPSDCRYFSPFPGPLTWAVLKDAKIIPSVTRKIEQSTAIFPHLPSVDLKMIKFETNSTTARVSKYVRIDIVKS